MTTEGQAQAYPWTGALMAERTASVVVRGQAFVQNLRRGHYELAVDAMPLLKLATAFDEQVRSLISPCPGLTSAWPAIKQRNRAGSNHAHRMSTPLKATLTIFFVTLPEQLDHTGRPEHGGPHNE